MTNRRLSSTLLTGLFLSIAAVPGCSGGGGPPVATPVVETPAPPAGFQEQQKAIGGNMMDARSVTAPQR